MRPGVRSGFPAKPVLLAEGSDGRQPKRRPPRYSSRWQIQESLCLPGRGCAQKLGWQGADEPTGGVPLPACDGPNQGPLAERRKSFFSHITGQTYAAQSQTWPKGTSGHMKPQCFVHSLSAGLPLAYENTGFLGSRIGKDLPNVTNLLHFSLTLDGYVT